MINTQDVKSRLENPIQKEDKQSISLSRIYTKNSLFEAAELTQEMIKNPPSPTVEMQIQVDSNEKKENYHEAVLGLQLTAKVNGNLLWRIQLQVAGMFQLLGFGEHERKEILFGFCMNQIQPYANSWVAEATVKAGFAPFFISPLNFDHLYREQQKQEAAKKH